MRYLRVVSGALALVFLGWAAWRFGLETRPGSPDAAAPSSTAPGVQADHRVITEDTEIAEIRIRYPVLGVAAADAELDRTVNSILAEFRANLTDLTGLPGPAPDWKNELRIEYTTSRFSRSIETVRLRTLVFTGGAHPNHATVTKTFDLRTGKELRLADVFLPGADHLAELSRIAREELMRSMPYPEEEMIRSGTEPTSENFANFMLDEQGIRLIFDPYQAGPYAAGTQEVYVHWTRLKDIVRPEFRPEFE